MVLVTSPLDQRLGAFERLHIEQVGSIDALIGGDDIV